MHRPKKQPDGLGVLENNGGLDQVGAGGPVLQMEAEEVGEGAGTANGRGRRGRSNGSGRSNGCLGLDDDGRGRNRLRRRESWEEEGIMICCCVWNVELLVCRGTRTRNDPREKINAESANSVSKPAARAAGELWRRERKPLMLSWTQNHPGEKTASATSVKFQFMHSWYGACGVRGYGAALSRPHSTATTIVVDGSRPVFETSRGAPSRRHDRWSGFIAVW